MTVRAVCNGQVTGPSVTGPAYCLTEALPALSAPVWGDRPPPWAPGRREEIHRVERMGRDQTVYDDRLCLLAEVDMFADQCIIKLGRGKITMLDRRRLADESNPS